MRMAISNSMTRVNALIKPAATDIRVSSIHFLREGSTPTTPSTKHAYFTKYFFNQIRADN
jgi:hypothetical protein